MVIENRGKLQHEAEELSILGDKFYARNDFSAAVSCYQKAAELGDKLAQYNLALMYDGGEGVEVNHAKAVYWYKKSASGLPEAQINLALCYYWVPELKKTSRQRMNYLRLRENQGIQTRNTGLGSSIIPACMLVYLTKKRWSILKKLL